MTAMPRLFAESIHLSVIPARQALARPPRRWFPVSVHLLSRRESRIAILIGAILLLSALDLALTVGQMCTAGFYEDNPIVVWLARSTDSWIAIAVYKSVTVAITSIILFRLRRYQSAECGAWLCVLVLVVLSVMWVQYLNELRGCDLQSLAKAGGAESGWIWLD